MTSEALAEQTEGIQLFIDQDDSGQVDSVVPVRWCISKELASQLQEADVQYPFMLLVITNGSNEMGRYVVPLMREMTYIRFSRPGINMVHATVVWKNNNTRSSDLPNRKLLDTRDRANVIISYRLGYDALLAQREVIDAMIPETDIIGEIEELQARRAKIIELLNEEFNKPYDSARLYESIDGVNRSTQETTLRVDVPAVMFAKEPPRIMKWFGTRYPIWNKAAVDQCHLRRRALITAATLPIVAPFVLLVALFATVINFSAATVLLVSGRRGIDFRPLRHPLTYAPAYAWDELGPSVWFMKKNTISYLDDDNVPRHATIYSRRSVVIRGINPFTVGIAVIGGCIISVLLNSLLWILACVGALLMGVLLATLFIRFFPDSWWERRKQRRKERQKAKMAELRAKRTEQLQQLACNTLPRPVNVAALPPEQQTIRLRFNQLKAKVCKPYAK